MSRDDIIRMALEARLITSGDGWTEPHRWGLTEIQNFAHLVAAAEREACASFLERGVDMKHLNNDPAWSRYYGRYTVDLLMGCAAVIRQRGQA